MTLVFTPSTLARNSGRTLMTISLEMSIKKLVRLTAHTLRGRSRTDAFFTSAWFGVATKPSSQSRMECYKKQGLIVLPVG